METRLKNESAALLCLIRSSICGMTLSNGDFEKVEWKYVYKLAKFHDIANIVCYAVENNKLDIPPETEEKFRREKDVALCKTASQMTAVELISRALDENSVHHCLLKGCVIRGLYPSVDMRTSGDVDVLYSTKDLTEQALEKLMKSLGFEKTKGSRYVDTFSDGAFVVVEMHRRLEANDDNGRLPDGFMNGLNGGCDDGNSFEIKMSPEDYYIYHIAHMAKHFRSHGCGIRPLVDLYLLNEKYGNVFDRTLIDTSLEKIGLGVFERRFRLLSQSIFDDSELDETSAMLLNVLMFSGVYGNIQRSATNDKTVNKQKATGMSKLVRTAFLPMENMRVKYPVLKRIPALLPVMWVVRVVDVFRRKSNVIRTSLETYKNVDDVAVSENKELMKRLCLK